MIGTTISDIKSVIIFIGILMLNSLIYILKKPDEKQRWKHDITGFFALSGVILVMWSVPAYQGRLDVCSGVSHNNCGLAAAWFLFPGSLWLYTLFSGLFVTGCVWIGAGKCLEYTDNLWSRLKQHK